jgi:hypothetical protein
MEKTSAENQSNYKAKSSVTHYFMAYVLAGQKFLTLNADYMNKNSLFTRK